MPVIHNEKKICTHINGLIFMYRYVHDTVDFWKKYVGGMRDRHFCLIFFYFVRK